MDLTNIETPELLIIGVVGILLLFAGYRIKKIAFFIIWFILGYTLMGYLMPYINQWVPQIASQQLWQILLPIAGGLLLALLGFTIEKFCVAGVVFGLTLAITAKYFGTDIQTLAIGAVVGVIVAGIAVVLMKPAIIVATALAGGFAITLAVLVLFPNLPKELYYWPILLGSALVGSVVQFMTTKRVD